MSILGPVIGNIFLADLFLAVKDDGTPFIVKDNIENPIASLEEHRTLFF